MKSSRSIVCPVHDVAMLAERIYGTPDVPEEIEWIIWGYPQDDCSNAVLDMKPGMPLNVRAFTSQETLHGDDMYQVDVDSMTQFASQPN